MAMNLLLRSTVDPESIWSYYSVVSSHTFLLPLSKLHWRTQRNEPSWSDFDQAEAQVPVESPSSSRKKRKLRPRLRNSPPNDAMVRRLSLATPNYVRDSTLHSLGLALETSLPSRRKHLWYCLHQAQFLQQPPQVTSTASGTHQIETEIMPMRRLSLRHRAQ
jgi:hypothetical protein